MHFIPQLTFDIFFRFLSCAAVFYFFNRFLLGNVLNYVLLLMEILFLLSHSNAL